MAMKRRIDFGYGFIGSLIVCLEIRKFAIRNGDLLQRRHCQAQLRITVLTGLNYL